MIQHIKIPQHIVEHLKHVVLTYPYKKESGSGLGGWISVGKVPKEQRATITLKVLMDKWFEMIDPEVKKWIQDNLPPYGKEILDIRGNIYGEGTSLSLHNDIMPIPLDSFFTEKNVDDWNCYTSVITLDRSEDLIGSYTVVGDLFILEECFGKTSKLTKQNLDIIDPQTGDCYVWDGYLLHGISEIKRGSRISIAIAKKID